MLLVGKHSFVGLTPLDAACLRMINSIEIDPATMGPSSKELADGATPCAVLGAGHGLLQGAVGAETIAVTRLRGAKGRSPWIQGGALLLKLLLGPSQHPGGGELFQCSGRIGIVIRRASQQSGRPSGPPPTGHNAAKERFLPPWTWSVHRHLLAVALAATISVGVIAGVIVMHPYLSLDAMVDRNIQATNWGPLTLTFPFFSWLGGPGGIYMQVVVILLVLVLNRRAWVLALAALAGGLWYEVIVNLVNRPRPAVGQILRVTEHPGSTSFPSGHLVFITTSAAVLMLCLGHRYLPRWARAIGWAVVAGVVLTVGLDRIYVGAHWPTDVLAGVLIATAWLTFVVSIRWISDRALET
jgi:membrane-associated phospholipid phosphatase